VNEPAVLLLDEPLGALDFKLRQQMQIELKNLQARVGTTFLYITHDQSEALTMSDRIAVMRSGSLEQVGSCEEVYERPRTLFVANFIGDSNVLKGVVRGADAANVVVDCGGLQVIAAPSQNVTLGQALALSVRPLRIQLGPLLNGCDNRFRGTVTETTYTGDIISYQVELPGANSVSVKSLTGEQRKYQPGDDIEIGWRKDHAVIVTSE
jgi:spermidine/putrescine transport system ATP-binding protein